MPVQREANHRLRHLKRSLAKLYDEQKETHPLMLPPLRSGSGHSFARHLLQMQRTYLFFSCHMLPLLAVARCKLLMRRDDCDYAAEALLERAWKVLILSAHC